MLPYQENLFLGKVSNSNKCRFGCDVTENYNHLFVACPKLTDTRLMIELIMKQLGFGVKLSYRNLLFGHKIVYPAYTQLNLLLSHIFYAIFKYWVKNNSSLSIKNWIFCELKYWQLVYSHTKASFDLLNKFISKWLELN